MGRKVFISFLGESFYTKVQYNQGIAQLHPTRFIQRATLEQLGANKWNKDSQAIILLTQTARDLNWDLHERINKATHTMEEYEGLKYELENMRLPFGCKDLPIKNGNNDSEMFEIFMSLFSELQDEDELYLDMTHGFRYLPMFLLVLTNYAQLLLKKIQIKSMSYGNVFTPNKDIMDLMPLFDLQRWTIGAADFVKNGSVTDLAIMAKNEVIPILSKTKGKDENALKIRSFTDRLNIVIDEIKLCRCKDIIDAKDIKLLRETADSMSITDTVPAFAPIKDRIMKSLEEFSSTESLWNGFAAAKWCLKNQLYQQCISYVEETAISYYCKKYNVPLYDVNQRLIVGSSFKIVKDSIPENLWGLGHDEGKKEANRELLRRITKGIDQTIAKDYCSMAELRNDINHTGMRENSASANKLRTNIESSLNVFLTYFKNWDAN